MTSQQRTKPRAAKAQPQDAFYLYCIGETAALAPLFEQPLPSAIEPEKSVEMISNGNLTAVVSAVALADYGEDELQAHLADSTWTALRAMRHEKIVEHFASRATVVPLRFGAIYLERMTVMEMLAARREEFHSIIERLQGRQEWGINVYLNDSKLTKQITSLSRDLRELSERADSAAPGQAYLMRKKIDAMRADEMRLEKKRVGREIEKALTAQSEATARLRVLKDEATEDGDLAFKYAFLVPKTQFDEFRSTAEQLAREHRDAGFRIELTGPWPAYNFATAKSNG
jgi:hypothetical protein